MRVCSIRLHYFSKLSSQIYFIVIPFNITLRISAIFEMKSFSANTISIHLHVIAVGYRPISITVVALIQQEKSCHQLYLNRSSHKKIRIFKKVHILRYLFHVVDERIIVKKKEGMDFIQGTKFIYYARYIQFFVKRFLVRYYNHTAIPY